MSQNTQNAGFKMQKQNITTTNQFIDKKKLWLARKPCQWTCPPQKKHNKKQQTNKLLWT